MSRGRQLFLLLFLFYSSIVQCGNIHEHLQSIFSVTLLLLLLLCLLISDVITAHFCHLMGWHDVKWTFI